MCQTSFARFTEQLRHFKEAQGKKWMQFCHGVKETKQQRAIPFSIQGKSFGGAYGGYSFIQYRKLDINQ